MRGTTLTLIGFPQTQSPEENGEELLYTLSSSGYTEWLPSVECVCGLSSVVKAVDIHIVPQKPIPHGRGGAGAD